MKVKDAIEQLKNKNPDEEIIIAYWDQDSFPCTDNEWDKTVEYCDTGFSWEFAHDRITDIINYGE